MCFPNCIFGTRNCLWIVVIPNLIMNKGERKNKEISSVRDCVICFGAYKNVMQRKETNR